MRRRLPGSAGLPLRAVVVALIVVGFGLWQAWHCTDGTMTYPMAAATSMSQHSPTEHGAPLVNALADEEPTPGAPTAMAGLCITVLVGVAAALMLMGSPLRLLGMLRRLAELVLRPVEVAARAPALAQLCVSRT